MIAYMLHMRRSGSARARFSNLKLTSTALLCFSESEDGDAAAANVDSWMPRYPAALQCKDDPQDPTRILVPYCMRYETSGPNRTVFKQDNGEELVCVCNRCYNALAGEIV